MYLGSNQIAALNSGSLIPPDHELHFHVPVFQEMDSDAGAIARRRPSQAAEGYDPTHPPSAFCAFLNQVAIS